MKMIKKIDSKDNKRVVHAGKLKNKIYIKECHEFLIEGYKSIELALKAGLVKEIFTTKELDIDSSITQYLVNQIIIEKISSNVNPEGVVAVCETLPNFKPKKMQKVVYLDNIQDPGNMGTLIRTALAFNYDAVVISENSVSIYNSKVVSATKGAMFLIPIIYGPLERYEKDQKIIVSTLADNSIDSRELGKIDSFVLVLGNEAHGVSDSSLKMSDINVKISISNIDSLNVAIAGGILMEKFR